MDEPARPPAAQVPRAEPDPGAGEELDERLTPSGPESPHAFIQRRMKELKLGERPATNPASPKDQG